MHTVNAPPYWRVEAGLFAMVLVANNYYHRESFYHTFLMPRAAKAYSNLAMTVASPRLMKFQGSTVLTRTTLGELLIIPACRTLQRRDVKL